MAVENKNICDEIYNILTDNRSVLRRLLSNKEKMQIEVLIDSNEFMTSKTSDGKSIILELIPRGFGPLGQKLKNKTLNLTIDEYVGFGDIENTSKMLTENPDLIRFRSSYANGNLLHIATFNNSIELFKLLIEKGVDTHAFSDNYLVQSCQPIIFATLSRNIEVVKLLLEAGADVNSQEIGSGATPLHISTFNELKEMTKLLLEYGGDPLLEKPDGVTPLDNAINKKFEDIAEMINNHTNK